MPGNGALPGNFVMKARVEQMLDRISFPEPVFEAILASFHALEDARFASAGPGWTGWADSTLNDARRGPSILVRSGDLWASMTGGGNATILVTSEGWEHITDVAYAGFHQYGEGHNPVRKIVDLEQDAGTVATWFAMMEEYFFGA